MPVALEGRDLIGVAQTGTGKTAAFVLPLLNRLVAAPAERGRPAVRALVVVPTRELALQVEESVRTYGRFTGLRSMVLFGGVGMQPQFDGLRRGVHLVVATPGRLLDHVGRGSIDLSRVEILVLDEADRMLDMGFIPDVRRIVAELPTRRQTLLFSATMPGPVRELASSVLIQPEYVEIGRRSDPAATVTQEARRVLPEQKMDLLLHLLETEAVSSMLVFSRTRHRANRVSRHLDRAGFATAVLHSDRTQSQRERALDGFRRGHVQILVATDIAARGIDVDLISHVVNFDTPRQPEDYIHRIGRTGRAEATGRAITFVSAEEEPFWRDIERHTGRRIERKAFSPEV